MLTVRTVKEQEIEEIARLEQEIFPRPLEPEGFGIPGTRNRRGY